MKSPDHIVGITGASGSLIGLRLVAALARRGLSVGVLVTDAGRATMGHEIFRDQKARPSVAEALRKTGLSEFGLVHEYDNLDFFSSPASGSSRFRSVTVAPASMKSVSAMASSFTDTLLLRAVDVALKEKRSCVILPRESTIHAGHLENLKRLADLGARIILPVPAFYEFPQSIDDVVDHVVGRILVMLGIDDGLVKEWGSDR